MAERPEVATRPGYAAGTTIACVAGVRTGEGNGDFGRERNWRGALGGRNWLAMQASTTTNIQIILNTPHKNPLLK